MTKPTLFDTIREWIGGIAFHVFLWSIRMTEDEYIDIILEDRRREWLSEKNSQWFTK